MLELGKPGTAGAEKKELPVLRDGALVARLRASNWREEAIAVVGERAWVFARRKRELTGRWAADPEGSARLRARQTSFWRSSWSLDLEGTAVELRSASMWKGTHRYLAGDRQIAESRTTGGWSPRPALAADDALTLDQQVFLLWVELVISRRNTTATTAAIGGAAVAGGSS